MGKHGYLTLFSSYRWDCGMFMLKYIDFHSRGIKPCFSQVKLTGEKHTYISVDILRLRA